MQMISLLFYVFVALIYVILLLSNKFIKVDEKKVNVSNWILLVSSYIFMVCADYRYALLLAMLTLSTWFFSLKKNSVKIGVVIALLALGVFKYSNFFMESFAKVFGKQDYTALNIILPLGISFYVFSAISYLMDVKRGKIEARNLKDVALYIAFFPKITSGPIQRSEDFFTQMDKVRNIGWESFSTGVQIYCFGLFKKIVVADRLSVFVNQVYDTPMAFGSFTIFLAVVSYSLQIYFDFSGYSDMAIGVARIIGIKLPRNFNLPYMAHNVTELWKRWHITLSSWLQEYLYISLGGNRKGRIRAYFNLIATMVLGGLWHGANWTYIMWGLLHGIALVIHKLWMKVTKSAEKAQSTISGVLSVLITFMFTTFCWIFFRATTLEQSFVIIGRMFSLKKGIEHMYIWSFVAIIIIIVAIIYSFVKTKNKDAVAKKKNVSKVDADYVLLDLTKFWHLVMFFVFCGLIIGLAYTGGSPFIYGNY